MKMRKKVLALLLTSALAVSMCACGASNSSESETEETESVSEISVEETTEEQEEESTEKVQEEEEQEINHLGLTESEMEVIYSEMEHAFATEYLEPKRLEPKDFSFPEDFECWRYFAKYCMIRMEEPDASKERIQGLCAGMYNVSSENQTIMTIAAESFYQSVNEMDQLTAIQQFVISDILIESAMDLLTENVFAEYKK